MRRATARTWPRSAARQAVLAAVRCSCESNSVSSKNSFMAGTGILVEASFTMLFLKCAFHPGAAFSPTGGTATKWRAPGNEILQRHLADALPRQFARHLDAVHLGRRRGEDHAFTVEADLADLRRGEAHRVAIGVDDGGERAAVERVVAAIR